MANLNNLQLMGYLTRDPELRYTPTGTAVAKAGIGMNRNWKTEAGEEKVETCFVDWTAFGKTAETMSQYLKKGNLVYLQGRLKLDVWTDKATNQPRQKLGMIIESFQFLPQGDGKKGQAESDNDEEETDLRPVMRQPAPKAAPVEPAYAPDLDVPF